MEQKKNKTNKVTYTKKLVKWVVIISVINGTIPYILSLMGRDPVAELGGIWVGSILLTVVTYCTKAYFETKSQRKQDLEDFQAGFDSDFGKD